MAADNSALIVIFHNVLDQINPALISIMCYKGMIKMDVAVLYMFSYCKQS